MRGILIAAGVLVAGVVSGQSAHAGLLGDTVDGSYYFPDTATLFDDEGTGLVGTNAVFTFPSGDPNVTATVTDTQITLTFDADGNFAGGDFDGVVITDQTSSTITGVSIDGATTLAGFTSPFLSFTANSVSINLQGLVNAEADTVVIDVATGNSVVDSPEPISMSLLGTGLVGFFVARGRRKGA